MIILIYLEIICMQFLPLYRQLKKANSLRRAMARLISKMKFNYSRPNPMGQRRMSQPCAITDCTHISRALCHCCNQNLCRAHLNEHDDLLNYQLNPCADIINELNDRLNHINVKKLIGNAHEQLNDWRKHSHQIIDEYFTAKQQKLDEYVNMKIHNQTVNIDGLKKKINQLIQKQDTTTEDLNTISVTVQSLRREIIELEHASFLFRITQLELDDKLIQINDESMKEGFDFSTLMPPVHVMTRSAESPKPLISNDRVLLMHCDNRLCLLNKQMTIIKSVTWSNGWIWDMCWSSTLSRFFIITLNDIFMLDENTMELERLMANERYSFCSCTCSDTSLYISTNELGSSICEFSLSPIIQLINRWQPAELCRTIEIIQDMVFHKGMFAFIVENQTNHMKRMELRFAQTFEQLWTLQFDIVDPLHNAFRLGVFNCNEWLVVDWRSSQVFYITKDGQIQSKCTYDPVPYRCCQFGSDMLAISTRNSINFHTI